MPLIKSASRKAIGTNIKEMEAAGHPRAQAIAAALDTARRAKRAAGGANPMAITRPSWFERREASAGNFKSGLLNSHVGGRTDHLGISVPAGSYVIPADIVSGLGQGNTLNGAKILDQMFKMAAPYGMHTGPYGMTNTKPKIRSTLPKKPKPGKFAAGGAVPIMAAGGEYVISPDDIAKKFGDVDAGHKVLDQFVVKQRKKLVKHISKLKPPAKAHEKN